MANSKDSYLTVDDWLAREAIAFDIASPETFNDAVAKLVLALGNDVRLLGFGEPMHGGEAFLQLRNALFRRLVEAHGFSAVAIESSLPRGRFVDEYAAGRGAASYDDVRASGFSHTFGEVEANRELVEWMRTYNAAPAHQVGLRFYGFDSPTEMMSADSPRQLLHFALDYLQIVDPASSEQRRRRMERLIGEDADWENPAAMMEPATSVGLSANAAALRIEVEDFISELRIRRSELVTNSDEERYLEAVHYAASARHLLNYHAGVARPSTNRVAELLGVRDLMMADNLAYIVERERGRGRVLAYAHNSHLKRGQAHWQWGPQSLHWWPAGAHAVAMLGLEYAVIGGALGTSEANGIDQPGPGSLEARLIATPGPARFVPTHLSERLPTEAIAALPTRSSSVKNPSYFPLTPQSITDFDWLAVLDSTEYTRGGSQLP